MKEYRVDQHNSTAFEVNLYSGERFIRSIECFSTAAKANWICEELNIAYHTGRVDGSRPL